MGPWNSWQMQEDAVRCSSSAHLDTHLDTHAGSLLGVCGLSGFQGCEDVAGRKEGAIVP